MRKSHHSLHGLLRRSLLRSVVCMILPVCVLAGLLVVLTQRYDADIALTTRASEVRTVLVQDLPDEVWNVVSGRISFEDGRQRMLIDSALWELNDMLDSAGEDEAQYLNAALRAIRTIDSYVDQLETQMDAGAAVSRNESLYREIHSVGHLAGSMLDRYIENEIARIRKAPGAEDISGDCNAYAEQTELTSGDAAVTMKGADGLVQLAIWQADGYTYAVSVENGLTADAMAELVAQVR